MTNAMTNANAIVTVNNSVQIGMDDKGRQTVMPIITSMEQYSSLFPTQSWSAWDDRSLLWSGVGKDLSHDMTTNEVFTMAGLDYGIVKVPTYINRIDFDGNILTKFDLVANGSDFIQIPMYAIIRDDKIEFLGSGTEQMNPLANEKTKELCNLLFKLGFRYENAGVFDKGKVTYVSMKWKGDVLSGEKMDYYVVIINSFDGTKPFGIYITPIRISCKNTMNLAVKKAVRFWKIKHTKTAEIKLQDVQESLMAFEHYIHGLDTEIDRMKMLTMNDDKVMKFFETLFPIENGMTQRLIDSRMHKRKELAYRYLNAPDLDGMEKSAFRLMCAVTDYADHALPQKNTENWKANRFLKNMSGTRDIVVETQKYIDSMF